MAKSRSATFEYIKEKMLADESWRPTVEMIEQVKAEWRAADAEWERQRAEERARIQREPLTICDFIEMPPDWHTSRVTAPKIQWYLDRKWTFAQIAKELRKTEDQLKRTLARAGLPPKEKRKPVYTKENVPFGWRLRGEKIEPDDMEQWVLEKMSKDREGGKKLDEIAAGISKLGIKPKGGGLWFGRRVSKVLQENQALLIDFRAQRGRLPD